jgi:uncharacterized protein (TIGR00730 family)
MFWPPIRRTSSLDLSSALRHERKRAHSGNTMKEARAGRLCVYCGSSLGEDPVYREMAELLGREIATAGLQLVYGGGGHGLMGALARAVKASGGHVTGIVPTALLNSEGLDNVGDSRVVDNYHQRKTLMLELSDGFAAFPGGPGTLEELAEQLAWAEHGHHRKPIYIVNINGYWDKCLAMLARMHAEGFTTPEFVTRYTVVNGPMELVTHFLERWRMGA